MYPSFILIDSEGKIFINPAPMPSENLEQAVASMVQKG
jgi:biopolymer transport protein ExbD